MKRTRESFLLSGTNDQAIFAPIQISVYESETPQTLFTGNLGNGIQESFWITKSFLCCEYDSIARDFFSSHTIHIHMPYGLIEKKGPSGGLTVAMMVSSLLLDFNLKKSTIYTGEMSLTGEIFPIGNLQEKITEELLKNFSQVIIPLKNNFKFDTKHIKIKFVNDIHELLSQPQNTENLRSTYGE